MSDRPSWRTLLPGVAAIAAVVLIALGVLLFAGIGQIRGRKMHLYVAANQARGVLRGTEVWIAGQKVGLVNAVEFAPPSADSAARLVIAVEVRARDARQIRRDSRAELRAGTNLIGPTVVSIDVGTPGTSAVREGDTIRAKPQSDAERAGARLSEAAKDVGPIMADARTVLAFVRDSNGTVGAVMREGGGAGLRRLRDQVSRVRRRMAASSAPDLSALTARVGAALARADSVRALLESPDRSLGRFRRDSTLGGTVSSIRDELASLQRRLDADEGNVWRLRNDSALVRAVADTRLEMQLLFDDIRRRPLHYIAF